MNTFMNSLSCQKTLVSTSATLSGGVFVCASAHSLPLLVKEVVTGVEGTGTDTGSQFSSM